MERGAPQSLLLSESGKVICSVNHWEGGLCVEVVSFCFLWGVFVFVLFFWPCWVFVAAHGLSLVVASGDYSSFHCVGFSSCGSWALECRLSSCGARA